MRTQNFQGAPAAQLQDQAPVKANLRGGVLQKARRFAQGSGLDKDDDPFRDPNGPSAVDAPASADMVMVGRAAGLRGRSRTGSVRAAEDVLMQTVLIRMSPDGCEAFTSVLSAPPAAVSERVAVTPAMGDIAKSLEEARQVDPAPSSWLRPLLGTGLWWGRPRGPAG
jgi:uncharacterized protein (DUF1778 family)